MSRVLFVSFALILHVLYAAVWFFNRQVVTKVSSFQGRNALATFS